MIPATLNLMKRRRWRVAIFQRLNLGKYPIGNPSRRRLLAERSGAALFAEVFGAVSFRPLAPRFSDLFGSQCDCK
jgi:hypothetical protein